MKKIKIEKWEKKDWDDEQEPELRKSQQGQKLVLTDRNHSLQSYCSIINTGYKTRRKTWPRRAEPESELDTAVARQKKQNSNVQ